MRVKLNMVGMLGINADTPPHELPPEIWSRGKNVRMRDRYVEKFLGHTTPVGTPPAAPYYGISMVSDTTAFWVHMGLAKAHVLTGTTHTDITRVAGDYTGSENTRWTGTDFGGVLVLTNEVDLPQYWSQMSVVQKLQNLPNWNANHRCRSIRSFRNFLIAMNITKSGTRYPRMVKWSHPAQAGAVPTSWDETDPTKDAGEYDLADTAGQVIDGMILGDDFIIYKENSCYRMSFVGGRTKFSIRPLFREFGVAAVECVREYNKQHFVFTQDDLLVHNGIDVKSLLSARWRKALAARINPDYRERSYLATNFAEEEIWACFCSGANDWPDLAIVYNMGNGEIGFRDLPNCAHIGTGPVNITDAGTFDGSVGTFNSDTQPFDLGIYDAQVRRMLGFSPINTDIFFFDDGIPFDGTYPEAYIERLGIAFAGRDRSGQPKEDFQTVKHVSQIWPKVRVASPGQTIEVTVFAQDTIDSAVRQDGPYTFTPGVDNFVPVDITGRILGVKFGNQAGASTFWRVDGFDMEIHLVGEY